MSHQLFTYLSDRNSLVEVDMDDMDMIAFRDVYAIGTANLAGCSVIGIASPYAAIIAHIPPMNMVTRDVSTATDYASAKMNEVIDQFNANPELFPVSESHILVAYIRDENGAPDIALPAQLAAFQLSLQTLPASVETHFYDATYMPYNSHGNTFVITQNDDPTQCGVFYINDELVNVN